MVAFVLLNYSRLPSYSKQLTVFGVLIPVPFCNLFVDSDLYRPVYHVFLLFSRLQLNFRIYSLEHFFHKPKQLLWFKNNFLFGPTNVSQD